MIHNLILSNNAYLTYVLQVMLSCWAKEPENRPPFSTLRQDLDDFDTSVELKYSKYDDLLPTYERKGKGDREAKMKGRVRRKKDVN